MELSVKEVKGLSTWLWNKPLKSRVRYYWVFGIRRCAQMPAWAN